MRHHCMRETHLFEVPAVLRPASMLVGTARPRRATPADAVRNALRDPKSRGLFGRLVIPAPTSGEPEPLFYGKAVGE